MAKNLSTGCEQLPEAEDASESTSSSTEFQGGQDQDDHSVPKVDVGINASKKPIPSLLALRSHTGSLRCLRKQKILHRQSSLSQLNRKSPKITLTRPFSFGKFKSSLGQLRKTDANLAVPKSVDENTSTRDCSVASTSGNSSVNQDNSVRGDPTDTEADTPEPLTEKALKEHEAALEQSQFDSKALLDQLESITSVLLSKFEELNQEDPVEAGRVPFALGRAVGRSKGASPSRLSTAHSKSFRFEDEFAVTVDSSGRRSRHCSDSSFSDVALPSDDGQRRPRVARRVQLGPITARMGSGRVFRKKPVSGEEETNSGNWLVFVQGKPYFNPRASLRNAWLVLVSLSIVYISIATPLRISWSLSNQRPLLVIMEILLDVLYLVDIGTNFMTGVDRGEHVVYDYSVITKSYCRKGLVFDLVSILPLDWIMFWSNSDLQYFNFLRLLKLLRLLRMPNFFYEMAPNRSVSSSRLISIIFFVLFFVHLVACTFLFFALYDGHHSSWIDRGVLGSNRGELSQVQMYLDSLYFAVALLSGVGYGDFHPVTTSEKLFCSVAMFASASGVAIVISHVSTLMDALDSREIQYKTKVEEMNSYLVHKNVPESMLKKFRDYYYFKYVQLGTNSFEEHNNLLSNLSPSLRLEVIVHINRSLISKVPFFQGASDDLLQAILSRVSSSVWAPGDMIVRYGEFGREMYFIKRGEVKVLGADGAMYKTMSSGEYFGEVALLLKIRRTANVFASRHCELLRLRKADFDEILAKFPKSALSISEYAKRTKYMFNTRRLSQLERKWLRVSSHMKAVSHGELFRNENTPNERV